MMDSLFPGIAAILNLHPVFVHFPIAFFIGAALLEIMAVFYHERFHVGATWLLYMGVFSSVITVTTGFVAAISITTHDPRGHDAPAHDFIHIHRNWMLATTLFSIMLSVYFLWANERKKWPRHRWGLLIGLLLLALLLSLGADRGARLVFEFGVGVNPEIIIQSTEGEDLNDGLGH